MGLFDFLKGKEQPAPAAVTFPADLGAPASGTAVTMAEIPDEVFSTGVLGKCCGVAPSEGGVYAPMDGRITQLTETLHAVGLEAGGIEVLIHMGVDTVDMNGDGITGTVRAGQSVKKGDLLLTADLERIRAAGHADTVIMVVTHTDDFASVEETASGTIQAGETLLRISK